MLSQHKLAQLSLVSFFLQALILLSVSLLGSLSNLASLSTTALLAGVAIVVGLTSVDFGVWWRAGLLGNVFAFGVYLVVSGTAQWNFASYVIFLSLFHFSEYLATAWTNPSNLSTDSFLLNHSPAYHLAAVASWAEYGAEAYFWPSLKVQTPAVGAAYVGFALCFGGEVLRKLAMHHAGKSFNHLVQSTRNEDHVLVTSGVFSLVRHPSYAGWFSWSVGTQLLLCNPVCFVAYLVVSWKFFAERIYIEEYTLLQFFGQDYLDYKKKVPKSGLPFIHGYDRIRSE